jgi:HlyD family secretion protein
MTANATFFVTEKKDIVLVPSKAIRFTPDPEVMAAYMAENGATVPQPQVPNMGEGARPMGGSMSFSKSGNDSTQMVWIKEGTNIHPKKITVGVTNEAEYEVVNGLNGGEEVVVSMTSSAKAGKAASKTGRSPFMPQPPGATQRTPTTNTQQGPPPM